MRSKTVIILALVLGLGLATSAMAATHLEVAYGVIAKADGQVSSLWIRRANETTQFTLAPNATVMRGDHKVTLNDLRLGERVKIAYTDANGTRLANVITVSAHHHG